MSPIFASGSTPAPEVLIQPKITGYRQLSPAEASLMNEVKALGIAAGELVAKLRGMNLASAVFGDDGEPLTPVVDQRWVSIGATDLQTGLMALTRAVAQPTTF